MFILSFRLIILFFSILVLKTSAIGATPKSVVYIASDFQNGGVNAVYRGFEEAALKRGWKTQLENGKGNSDIQRKILETVISKKPDGIIFGGFQANEFPDLVKLAQKEKIILIGWHSSAEAGPTKELFVNITTNAVDVANMAARYVINDAKTNNRKVGVIIFNDNQYAIANLKSNTMKQAIEKCDGYKDCKVLAIKNVLISEASSAIPEIVPKLNSIFKDEWTYSLAINDAYFDTIHFPLLEINRTDIILVSAGDGSEKAVNRIELGNTQQKATVAEPLTLQGQQIADELNRAFNGQAPSGIILKPVLITKTK